MQVASAHDDNQDIVYDVLFHQILEQTMEIDKWRMEDLLASL